MERVVLLPVRSTVKPREKGTSVLDRQVEGLARLLSEGRAELVQDPPDRPEPIEVLRLAGVAAALLLPVLSEVREAEPVQALTKGLPIHAEEPRQVVVGIEGVFV